MSEIEKMYKLAQIANEGYDAGKEILQLLDIQEVE